MLIAIIRRAASVLPKAFLTNWVLLLAFLVTQAAWLFGALHYGTARSETLLLATAAPAIFVGAAWSGAQYRSLLAISHSDRILTDTLRLLCAGFLVWFLIALAAAILSVGFFLAAGILSVLAEVDASATAEEVYAALQANGTIYVAYALVGLMLLIALWLSVKLYMYGAATVDFGAISVLRGWDWTKGHFWTLGACVILFSAAPSVIAGFVGHAAITGLGGPSLFAVLGGENIAALERQPTIAVSLLAASLWAILSSLVVAIGHAGAASTFSLLKPNEP